MTRIDPSTVLPVLDEVSHTTLVYFLIGVLVIYIAWRSTFVRHEARNIPYRQRTVFIFNPQTGDFQQHSLGLLLNNLNNNLAQTTPTFESILDEMNGITYQTPPQQDESIDDDSVIEEETQEIIREMDREPNNSFENTNGLRNRRTNTGYVCNVHQCVFYHRALTFVVFVFISIFMYVCVCVRSLWLFLSTILFYTEITATATPMITSNRAVRQQLEIQC